MPCRGIPRCGGGLGGGAEPLHEAKRVDMAFIKPAQRQAGAAEQAQCLGKGSGTRRLDAPTVSAKDPAQRCRQQTCLIQRGERRRRKGTILVLGRRRGSDAGEALSQQLERVGDAGSRSGLA